MNKKTKDGCCGGNCGCDHKGLDLNKAKAEAEKLIKNAKGKFDKLSPEQKKKLKTEAAIGGALALGLWGLTTMLGGKKKAGKGKKK